MKNKITPFTIVLFIVFALMIIPTGEVNAASGKWRLGVSDGYAENPMTHSVDVFNTETQKNAEIIKVTSSKKNVIKVNKYKYDGITYWSLLYNKVGKSKITVSFKKPNGKTATLKKTIKSKKYPNPIQSIEINGKKIDINKHKFLYDNNKYKKKSIKIKITLKNGWKLANGSADAANWKKDKRKGIKVNNSTFTKGKEFKIPKGYHWTDINLLLSKNNQFFNYYIGLGQLN